MTRRGFLLNREVVIEVGGVYVPADMRDPAVARALHRALDKEIALNARKAGRSARGTYRKAA